MSETTQFIILSIFLVFFILSEIFRYLEKKIPVYMKPRGFFKLYDNSDKILAMEKQPKYTQRYVKSLLVDEVKEYGRAGTI